MILESIRIRHFRNLEAVDLEPGPGLNTLSGDNGQGKTAFLEALCFLAEGRSFRSTVAASLVTEGSAAMNVRGQVRIASDETHELEVGFGRSGTERGRKLKRDGHELRGLSEHLGSLRVVVHSPEDLNLISGPPEMRRRFLNRILVLLDAGRFQRLQEYTQVLRNRNQLLRESRTGDQLEVWTDQLVKLGAEFLEARVRLVADLVPRVKRLHSQLAGPASAAIEIGYRSAVGPLDPGVTRNEIESRLEEALKAKRERELDWGRTLVGPQLDDLEISMRSSTARLQASQGERRTALIAMRLAERELLAAETNETPVFLVDDLSSELDRGRTHRVLELVEALEGQVFLTGTEEREASRSATRGYEVVAGVITEHVQRARIA